MRFKAVYCNLGVFGGIIGGILILSLERYPHEAVSRSNSEKQASSQRL